MQPGALVAETSSGGVLILAREEKQRGETLREASLLDLRIIGGTIVDGSGSVATWSDGWSDRRPWRGKGGLRCPKAISLR
jgi:hypothetical protein